MTEQDFVKICKNTIVNYVNSHLDKSDNIKISEENVYVVWLSKVLQNNKAMLSTTLPDLNYYEITYNGDKHELYFDVYKKWENKCMII